MTCSPRVERLLNRQCVWVNPSRDVVRELCKSCGRLRVTICEGDTYFCSAFCSTHDDICKAFGLTPGYCKYLCLSDDDDLEAFYRIISTILKGSSQ